ncbi:MAG: small acid-soluble spore protein P [Sporomusaceae bacterium]|nr:small acid-soluble spore protein P [Sporomusaceae bacterium]
MPKPDGYLTDPSPEPNKKSARNQPQPEPLSGSKAVKNQGHKGQKHGEGR